LFTFRIFSINLKNIFEDYNINYVQNVTIKLVTFIEAILNIMFEIWNMGKIF